MFPNGTFEQLDYAPWHEARHDANDTAERALDYRAPREGPDATEPERIALAQALSTANTPTRVERDPLGRSVAEVATVEDARELTERARRDVRGLSEETVDRRDQTVSRRAFDRLGRLVLEWSADAGESRSLFDALGREARVFREAPDASGDETEERLAYDRAGRLRSASTTGSAVARYERTYRYDDAGNLRGWRHAPIGAGGAWRHELWLAPDSNRGAPAKDLNGIDVRDPERSFDRRGQLVRLPSVRALEWSARSLLRRAVLIRARRRGRRRRALRLRRRRATRAQSPTADA